MSAIDWQEIPLEDFSSKRVEHGDGTYTHMEHPYGDGVAQRIVTRLSIAIDDAYEDLMRHDADLRELETFKEITLRDLPVVLDALAKMEEENKQQEQEEAERKAAQRKEVERIRAKERRNLKKLGEWYV